MKINALQIILKLSTLIFFTHLSLSQSIYAKPVPVKVQKLSDSVYMLTGRGGNLGFSVGVDGVVVIDDQFDDMADNIREAIRKTSKQPIRMLLNTHWHGDHTGGNEKMHELGAIIIAQENVRKRLTTDQFMKAFKKEVKAKPRSAWPVVTFTQSLKIHLNDDTLVVNHLPHAHTDGDAFIFFKEDNIIHTGDLYFSHMFPFIDVGSGGSLTGMISGVKAILKLANDKTQIIPGHGKLSNKKELQEYLKMLTSMQAKLQALAKQGKSLDEAVMAKPLAELSSKWEGGFMKADNMVQLLYPSIVDEMKSELK